MSARETMPITRRGAITGAAATAFLPAPAHGGIDRLATPQAQGTVFDAESADRRGIPGVLVSNGEQVVRTDQQGRCKLPITPGAAIFVIKPSDWRTPLDANNLPRYS